MPAFERIIDWSRRLYAEPKKAIFERLSFPGAKLYNLRMSRGRKISIAAVAVLIILALLHFVPADRRTEYQCNVTNKNPGYYTFRGIPGGVNQWDNLLSQTGPQKPGCKPLHIKLYLF
jgi:hypothetical protein